MQSPDPPYLAFQRIDATSGHGGDTMYAVALVALVGGIAALCIGSSAGMRLLGVGLIAGSCLGYARLLRTTPALHYFRYFWLDANGVHHIGGNSPAHRTAHFAWHEIWSVDASSSKDDVPGVTLTLGRPDMRDVPVLLSMNNHDEAERAAAAIRGMASGAAGRAAGDTAARISWWLEWGSLPETQVWALLTVDAAGAATVLACDGRTHRFTSEEEARNWLLEDDFSMLEHLDDEFDLTDVSPPSAPTEAELVSKMAGHGRRQRAS